MSNQEKIIPLFKENFSIIAMSSSEEYFPYLSVYLQSLCDNTSDDWNYDVVIFTTSRNESLKQIILDSYQKDNIVIRYYNPKQLVNNLSMNITHEYFNEACYYRIIAPLVLELYDKIIFTDIDLIIQKDIKFLGQIRLDNNAIGACIEPIWKRLVDNNSFFNEISIKKYSEKILKLDDICKYYNTGVLLVDTKKYKAYYNSLIDAINQNYFIYQEQCALNKIFKNNIFILPKEWNYEVERNIDKNFYKDISTSIIHFLGKRKPWFYPDEDFADIWWEYAKKTPFYEEIVKRYKEHKAKRKNEVKKELKLIKFKVHKYSLLSFFTFGKKHKYYHDKLVDNKRYLDYLLQENN